MLVDTKLASDGSTSSRTPILAVTPRRRKASLARLETRMPDVGKSRAARTDDRRLAGLQDEVDRVLQGDSRLFARFPARRHRVRMAAAVEVALNAAVHGRQAGLEKVPAPEMPEPVKLTPPVPIRKTVTDQHIVSLEDGKPYKTLKRHLGKLGLTPDQYRAKWGLPKDYPMVSAAYSRSRSALAKEIGLGAMRRKG